jgi:hypothetical protein
LEAWAARFRRPNQPPEITTPRATPTPQPQPEQPAPDGVYSAFTASLRLAEQILFVFVASLWPNAVADHQPIDRELRPADPPQQENRNGDENGDEQDGERRRLEGEQERLDIVVQ